eukprot:619410-Prorocentrum_minimum.AAC.1
MKLQTLFMLMLDVCIGFVLTIGHATKLPYRDGHNRTPERVGGARVGAVCFAPGVPRAQISAVTQVCHSNDFPPCDEGYEAVDVNPGVVLGHNPTCFNPDITNSTLVNSTDRHAVRCYSPSTTLAATPTPCGQEQHWKTLDEAVAVCMAYRGKEGTSSAGVSDWRIPLTPAEAGRGCGSGCGYDSVDVWVGFGALPSHCNTRNRYYVCGLRQSSRLPHCTSPPSRWVSFVPHLPQHSFFVPTAWTEHV